MIALVHLVWAPLGPEPVRRFLGSYREHPAGEQHRLVVLLNGAGAEGAITRDQLAAELGETEHQLIVLPSPVLDLDAYLQAARQLEEKELCFLNSYAQILDGEWLVKFAGALREPGVGIAGASGSWESQAEWRRGRLLYWPLQLAKLPATRRDYPRFPNPHVRTGAFMIRREELLAMEFPAVLDKPAAYRVESGRQGITARIRDHGGRAVVVGRDGRAYEESEWAASRTFRSGRQQNLLVADNRTLQWQLAPAREKAILARDAWGRQGSV